MTQTAPVKHRTAIRKASEKHRNNIGKTSEKKLNRSQKEIIAIISLGGHITTTEIADMIGISRRNVEENIRVLREEGILVRRGGRKEGYWEIIPKED